MTQSGDLTVLMITHKFREVMAFADEVTVLRTRQAGRQRHGRGARRPTTWRAMMIGADELTVAAARAGEAGAARLLSIEDLDALDDTGRSAVHDRDR